MKLKHRIKYVRVARSECSARPLERSRFGGVGKENNRGEQQRTAQGGIPIYNPTIARVKVHYDIFLDSYERQKNLQALTNRSLEELASMRGRADELILDIWNQVETKYQDVTPK